MIKEWVERYGFEREITLEEQEKELEARYGDGPYFLVKDEILSEKQVDEAGIDYAEELSIEEAWRLMA